MNQSAAQAAVAARHKYEQKCPDCGSSDFVDDFSQGDLICRDKQTVDPNRVGGPTNHLLPGGGLATTIAAAASGDKTAANLLQKAAARSSGGGERNLVNAFRSIGAICERLGLVKIVKDRACEIYKQVTDTSAVRGRQQAAMHAAAVYMACRQEHNPRTIKEILAGAPNTTKVEIGRAYTALKRELGAEIETIHPADYVRRFCSRLGLNNTDMKVANEVAEKACPRAGSRENGVSKPWDGRSPTSIAAALIWMLTSLPKASAHPSASEVSQASGVAEATIHVAYKDLVTDASALVPRWFASTEELSRLPQAKV